MADPTPIVREAQRVRRGKATIIRWARKSSAVFAQYVIKDEEDGSPIRLSPTHKAWHQLCDEHRNVLIWSHVESGKTWQMSIARTLWEIGKNPNSRWIVLSNTKSQAAKIISTLKEYIDKSEELHEVFPHLRRGTVWGEYRFTVDRKTFQAMREAAAEVHVARPVRDYAVRLARATRDPIAAGASIEALGSSSRPCVTLGASPRGSMYLVRAARARALLDRRSYATPHDIKRVANDVLRHRVVVSYEAEADGIRPEAVIEAVLSAVEAP